MGESRYCILAPGLGNFIETLTLDKEIMYLPSINYSQHQQLEFYKEKGFGFTTLNWSEFDFYEDIPKYLEEETGVKLVNSNIEKYLNGNYEKVITNIVNRFINNNQKQYFKIRNNFARALKSNAAKEIAEIIYDENK